LQQLEAAARLDPSLEASVASLRRAILRSDASTDPAYRLVETGRALANIEQWDLAARALRQAVDLRPDYAEAWAYLGEALQHPTMSQGGGSVKSSTGLPELQESLRLNPASLVANTFLGLYWLRNNRPDLAVPALQTAVKHDPENPALLLELGRAQAASGDLKGAEAAHRQAISLSPYDSTYVRALVDFSLQNDYNVKEIALPAARELAAADPPDPANLDLMAQVLVKLSDLANAERFLRRALQIDPNYAPAHMHLGLVFILQGNRSAGRQALQQAVQIAPGSVAALQAQRLLQTYLP
jgi:cytochrome c-type biogenesis protein CcmH/NrfG